MPTRKEGTRLMAATIAHPQDIPRTDAQRIADLENQVADLAAKLDKFYRRACLLRRHEEIFAETLPGYLTPARAHLTLVRDESCRAILEAARS
jgi:hypothetical protein